MKIVANNGRIRRSPRRVTELHVLPGGKTVAVDRLEAVEDAVKNLEAAFRPMVDAHEDARDVALQLMAMYREASKR